MGHHRDAGVRPRYGRMAAAATSFTVTGIAVLGGAGFLPSAAQGGSTAAVSPAARPVADAPVRSAPEPVSSRPHTALRSERQDTGGREAAVPPRSGEGKRVVFSEGAQRVWLVRADGKVARTYLVSGSVYDNLDPGTYSVYSRSEQAWGIDDSGTMKYFVRFTTGDNAAIGFHDIPVDDGRRVQTFDQLGTPQSHGCIRQRRADAVALWEFAPLGTTVVVTA